MPRVAQLIFAALVCVFASMMLVAFLQPSERATSHALSAIDSQHVESQHAQGQRAEVETASHVDSAERYTVTVRQPSGPPRIELAGADPQGRVGSVACSTCHSVRKPNLDNKTAASLDEFHSGMSFDHGSIACYACHNPNDADALRLADGSSLAFENVLTLCSQCHSKQAESFAHGAHGGMNGHWDLNRGPQTKNNCIDCHDPHVPKYPKMIVEFKPKDRFNDPPRVTSQHADLQHAGGREHDDE